MAIIAGRNGLLFDGKQAYFVKGYDADRFFVELARKLDCFPPHFVERPFTHLRQVLDALTEFKLPGSGETDVLYKARQLIDGAIQQHEGLAREGADALRFAAPSSTEALELAATALLMAGKYSDVQAVGKRLDEVSKASMAGIIAWSFIAEGNDLFDRAKAAGETAADALFRAAEEKYAEAVRLKPDKHEAFNNWGLVLAAWAQTKAGDEADALFRAAGEKYAEAVRLKPDYHEAFYNWGSMLDDWARTKDGEAADALFRAAAEKYAEAVRLKPDMHEAFHNWGNALLAQAQLHKGAEAEGLLAQAEDRLKQAEALKRGSGAYNLACIASLRGQEGNCRQWLEEARDAGTLPDKAHLEADTDLDLVRDTDWFRAFIASL